MGKIKTRILGLEEVEEKQKKEQKEKAAQKKAQKKKEKVEEKKQEEVKKPEEKKPEKKTTQPKPRGKRYEENKKIVDRTKVYPLAEAISLLKKMKTASFDESVELHLVVEEQGLKGEVELPYSTGKTVKVAIVDDKVLAAIEAGKIDFDVLITHPSYMPKLAKFAKVLGPKGLMPNPKAGTISPNPEEVAKKFQKGVLRWKTEPKAALIHQMLGKISMKEEELKENIEAFLKSVGAKNIKKAYLKTTMSPSVKIEIKI
jgi:large subunit ribosomal protein L1